MVLKRGNQARLERMKRKLDGFGSRTDAGNEFACSRVDNYDGLCSSSQNRGLCGADLSFAGMMGSIVSNVSFACEFK
jgi:hypothetical protein